MIWLGSATVFRCLRVVQLVRRRERLKVFRRVLADLDGVGDGSSEICGREWFFEGGSKKGEAIFV